MLDLAADYVRRCDVSVMCWKTPAGHELLDGAAALGATAVPLPRPRDALFGETNREAVFVTTAIASRCA